MAFNLGSIQAKPYELRVRAAGDLGDRVLANFVVLPADPSPTSPDCPDTSATPRCTSNPVEAGALPPSGGSFLPLGPLGPLGPLALLALSVGGIALVTARRRSENALRLWQRVPLRQLLWLHPTVADRMPGV